MFPKIREANNSENNLIAEHFAKMWLDIGISSDLIEPNCHDITLQFIEQARQNLSYKAFIAEVDDKIIGSVSCQLFAGLYPLILTEKERKYGYIWGIYVEAAYRHNGIGKKLTQTAIDYLKLIGCTRVILHAAPLARSLYSSLGFSTSNEMRLDLL
jgi:ribosomal protein S18 acetylase RimI-like enzyme